MENTALQNYWDLSRDEKLAALTARNGYLELEDLLHIYSSPRVLTTMREADSPPDHELYFTTSAILGLPLKYIILDHLDDLRGFDKSWNKEYLGLIERKRQYDLLGTILTGLHEKTRWPSFLQLWTKINGNPCFYEKISAMGKDTSDSEYVDWEGHLSTLYSFPDDKIWGEYVNVTEAFAVSKNAEFLYYIYGIRLTWNVSERDFGYAGKTATERPAPFCSFLQNNRSISELLWVLTFSLMISKRCYRAFETIKEPHPLSSLVLSRYGPGDYDPLEFSNNKRTRYLDFAFSIHQHTKRFLARIPKRDKPWFRRRIAYMLFIEDLEECGDKFRMDKLMDKTRGIYPEERLISLSKNEGGRDWRMCVAHLLDPRWIFPAETDSLAIAYRENEFLRALEYSSSDVDSPFFVQELLWDAKSGDPD